MALRITHSTINPATQTRQQPFIGQRNNNYHLGVNGVPPRQKRTRVTLASVCLTSKSHTNARIPLHSRTISKLAAGDCAVWLARWPPPSTYQSCRTSCTERRLPAARSPGHSSLHSSAVLQMSAASRPTQTSKSGR